MKACCSSSSYVRNHSAWMTRQQQLRINGRLVALLYNFNKALMLAAKRVAVQTCITACNDVKVKNPRITLALKCVFSQYMRVFFVLCKQCAWNLLPRQKKCAPQGWSPAQTCLRKFKTNPVACIKLLSLLSQVSLRHRRTGVACRTHCWHCFILNFKVPRLLFVCVEVFILPNLITAVIIRSYFRLTTCAFLKN